MTAPLAIIVTIPAISVAIAIVVIAAIIAIVAILIAIITVLIAVVAVVAIATFVGFAALVTPVIRLPAVVAMILDDFAGFVFCLRYAPLAIVRPRCLRTGRAREEKETAQRRRCERCLTEQGLAESSR